MRTVIQRVTQASVTIDNETVGCIGRGMMILLGIAPEDTRADADWLIGKISRLRIFDDANGVMNLSVQDIGGEALVVSQFTLMASYRKGNRPSYICAACPDTAIPLYEYFVQQLQQSLGRDVRTGRFGADMKVSLTNDGPVTIVMDSKNPE
ncbi:MAG: D-aminoacyl-tRNA deacylase [Bacteroides sp.]|nr:D-aminoacyl-tRNA deacylase [Bacteroides sp.]MCM1446713.1 D-aminoacyl-tRNA deacylase [Bacteroides sp.]MCM1514844.1 D-aminoacyl-tRNA deacylase [Paraprevotella sp.]